MASPSSTSTHPDSGPSRCRHLLLLLVLYLVLVTFQVLSLHDTPLMTMFYDEYLYDTMAVEMAKGKGPTMNQVLPPRYPPLYSVIMAPVAHIFGNHRFYPGRILNVLLLTLLLFAVYCIGRRFLNPAPALVAGVASVLGPGIITPPHFISENLYFPVFAFYLLAVIRLLERPTLKRSVVAGVLAAVCFWTKVVAIIPIGLVGLFFLFFLPSPVPGRVLRAVVYGATFLALVLPWVARMVIESLPMYAIETGSIEEASFAKYALTLLNHMISPLMSIGPLLVALVLASGIASFRRAGDTNRNLVFLFLLIIVSTIVVSALWIAAVRPAEIRVEERYQLVVYPLILVLALAAMESPPRGWLPWFLGLSALLLLVPAHQLDPDVGTFWYHVNPSPLLLRFWTLEIGQTWARIIFVSLWAAMAVAFGLFPNSRLRRIPWIGVLATGIAYFWIVSCPIREIKSRDFLKNTTSLNQINRLLDTHQGEKDRVLFAGIMREAIPYGISALRGNPYWYQQDLDSQNWYPGTLDNKTGHITWTLEPVERILLLTRDGVTRGGKFLAREGPWSLFVLDPRKPRLHSYLLKGGASRTGELSQEFEIYLWTLPPGSKRYLYTTPVDQSHPLVHYTQREPYLNTPDWIDAGQPMDMPIPSFSGHAVSQIQLKVKNGEIRVEIQEKPHPE